LTSQPVSQFSTYTTMLMFLTLFGVAVIVFVRSPTEELSPAQICVGLSGLAYYFGGFLLPIIGTRALQIGLLPLGVLAAARGTDPRVVKVIVLVALVLSPVIGLNSIVNSSIGAGGHSQNYHAHKSGTHLAEYDLRTGERALKYPRAGLPPEITNQQDQQILTLDELVREDTGRPTLVVYGPQQIHRASRYGRICNFTPQGRTILFDNGIQILKTSGVAAELNCVQQ